MLNTLVNKVLKVKIIHPHYYTNPVDLMIDLYEKKTTQPEQGIPYLFLNKILVWREFLNQEENSLNVEVIYDYGASLLSGRGNQKDLDSIIPFFEEAYFKIDKVGSYKSIDYKILEHSTLAFADGDASIHGLLNLSLSPTQYREFYRSKLYDEIENLASELKHFDSTYEAVKEFISSILEIESLHFKTSEIEVPFRRIESFVSHKNIPIWPKTILLALIRLESEGRFKINGEILEPIKTLPLQINLIKEAAIEEEEVSNQHKSQTNIRKNIGLLESKKTQLTSKWATSGAMSDDDYLEMKKALESQIKAQSEALDNIEQNQNNWIEKLESFFKISRKLVNTFERASVEDKRIIMNLISSKFILTGEQVNVELAGPFKALFEAKQQSKLIRTTQKLGTDRKKPLSKEEMVVWQAQ